MDALNTEIIASSVTPTAILTDTKGLGLSQAAALWIAGENSQASNPERPNRPYAQNEWVYTCVNEIIKACRSVQMMLSTPGDDIVESGAAYDFLFNNPDLPFGEFLENTVGFYTLYRTVYWVFDELQGMTPKKILVVGPQQLKPIIKNGVQTAWELHLPQGRKKECLLYEVYPITSFNPYGYENKNSRGIGPADVGKLAISASYQASLYNESVLANGGRVGNVISYPGRLDEDEKRMLRSQYESRHGGARNAGRVMVTSGGAEIKNFAQTMADLQMLDLREFDGKVLAMLHSVPSELINLGAEAQYAHGPAQQRFIVNTIGPLLTLIADHINIGILARFAGRQSGLSIKECKTLCARPVPLMVRASFRSAKHKALQSSQSLFAWFALEDHPTVQEMLRERAEKVLKYTTSGVPLNQIIDAYDLPFETEKIPWGDHYWINMSLVPAQWTLDTGPEGFAPSLPEGQPDEDEGKTLTPHNSQLATHNFSSSSPSVAKETAAQKLRLWNNWRISWAGLEREHTTAYRKTFVRQERELKAKLKKAWQYLNPTPKTLNPKPSGVLSVKDADAIIASVVFDLRKEDGKVKVINRIFFEKASELGLRQSLSEATDLKGEAFEEAVSQFKNSPQLNYKKLISANNVAQVNKTTQNIIARQLRQGLEAGEDLNTLAARISKVLSGNRTRALRIARTQTSGAVSTGRHEGFKAAGVKAKAWVTSGDELVRDAHKQAGSDYAAGIDLEAPFVVAGESLMYPGDPAGSPGNIINCRCLQIARRRAAAGKDLAIDFYSYEKMSSTTKDTKENKDNETADERG